MARSQRRIAGSAGRGYRGSRIRTGVRGARRVWPYVLMAWERWQSLSPEDKERYKKQARGYAERGRKALEEQRRRRPPRG
jgi:glycogen debranching enzyme